MIGTIIAENDKETLYLVGAFAETGSYDITIDFGADQVTFTHVA